MNLLQILKDRSARKAERKARALLQEIVDQTRAGYPHQRSEEGRKAALKNREHRPYREPYRWRRETA